MKQERIQIGFSPVREEDFLRGLLPEIRDNNLKQELKTQLAEDFGLVEFTKKYKLDKDGLIIDNNSRLGIVELTSRGGVEEETEAIKIIEEGLRKDPKSTWVHFSPKNEGLGYPDNCVDFWRVVDNIVVWNRMVVNNDFKEMNKVKFILSGNESKDEMEILKSPIGVNLKLNEISSIFTLSKQNYSEDFAYIERVVNQYVEEFRSEFGRELTSSSELIFRLYSACHQALKVKEKGEDIITRIELDSYMFGVLNEVTKEKSGGCAGSTTVGSFGEKVGYFVSADGKVSFGKIPDGFTECKQCGCWYTGAKCPFC